MHPGVISALCTLCAALAMAVYLSLRRYKEPLHWMLIGFLGSLSLWTLGTLTRFSVASDEALGIAVKMVLTGVLLSSSFWLMAAALYERERAEPRPGLPMLVLVATSLLALALFTNEGHRLFLRELDLVSVEAGPRAYAGPLFWVFLAWSYGAVAAGIGLYLRAARRMLSGDSRRRGLLLALATAAPLASSTLYVFQLVPITYDLTPVGLMVSLLMLSLAVFRFRLFESLPLARDAVVARLDDGVVMATASGRITHWNDAAARILGDPPLRPGDRLAEALERLGPAAGSAGGELPQGEIRTADGRVVDVTIAVVDEGRGEPSGQFAILSDRSEIERIERLARQTQRLEIVGALAADFAHEINDPLAFVRANLVEIERLGQRVDAERGGAETLLAAELSDLRAVALETLEGVDRMRRIVEGMRGLALGDEHERMPLDLARVIRDALPLARLGGDDWSAPSVQLLLTPTPPVSGNADALVQLVLNLLVNARQALAETRGPRIRIELARQGDEVELCVRDNGPGVPPELRHRIFDPFFTTRPPDEGVGLGLSIAFDIAREHGGVLEERGAPGGGGCFALRLPIARGAAAVQAGTAGAGGQVQAHLE